MTVAQTQHNLQALNQGQASTESGALVGLESITAAGDGPCYVVSTAADAEQIRAQGRDAVSLRTSDAIPSKEEWLALPGRKIIVTHSSPSQRQALRRSAKLAGIEVVVRARISSVSVAHYERSSALDVAAELFGSASPAETHQARFKLISRDQIESLPEQEWLIDGVLPKDSFVMLFGDPGVGKSFLALAMACSVATGVGWYGRQCLNGDVVYVAAEGLSGQKARLLAWEEANGSRANRLFFLGQTVDFMMRPDISALVEDMAVLDIAPVLVVIDTLARSMPGGDENSQRDMGVVIDEAEHLRKATGATVMVVHHSAKAGGYRGSSALLGAVSTSMEASRDGKLEVRLSCRKQKDAEPFDAMRFRLEPYAGSLVPLLQGSIQPALASGPQHLLTVLRAVGPQRNSEWLKATGLPRRTFNRHLAVLKAEGAVNCSGGIYSVVPTLPNDCHGSAGSEEDPTSAINATTLRGGSVALFPALGDVA